MTGATDRHRAARLRSRQRESRHRGEEPRSVSGRVKWTRHPCPGALSTRIVPPWSSTIRLTIPIPSPSPLTAALDASAR